MRFPIILRSAMEMAARMSWRLAALLAGLHFMISWLGLSLIGEDVAGSAVSMLYFYVTTATTVGYGDLSPEGDAGRLFTALFVMPGAILSFAWLLGQAGIIFTRALRKVATGMASYELRKGHNLFIGYIPAQTEILIAETDPGTARPVICTVRDIEGRVPEGLDWVRAEALSDVEALERAGAGMAGRIIIMTGEDEVTTSVCLSIAGNWPEARAVALFNDRRKGDLVARACPNIRSVVAPASMLLARAASCEGAEKVVDNLLSRRIDDALQSTPMVIGADAQVRYGEIRDALIAGLKVAPIGITPLGSGITNLCPGEDVPVRDGDLIHYISASQHAGFDIAGMAVAQGME